MTTSKHALPFLLCHFSINQLTHAVQNLQSTYDSQV